MERLTPLFRVSLMCFAICKAEHFHLFIYVFTPIRLGLKACSSPETHPLAFAFAVQEKKKKGEAQQGLAWNCQLSYIKLPF